MTQNNYPPQIMPRVMSQPLESHVEITLNMIF